MHHRANSIDGDMGVLRLTVPDPPVKPLDLRDDEVLRRGPARCIIRQSTRRQLRVSIPAHYLEVPADQRQNAGAALRDGTEYLPASTRSFDIADPDLHMALAFVTAPDERRVQTDIDSRRLRRALPGGRVTKLISDFYCMTPQCFRACAGLHGQEMAQ